MNATQLKYARDRLNEVYRERQAVVRKAHPPVTTVEDRRQALLEGDFKVLDHVPHGVWHYAVKFPDLAAADAKREKDLVEALEALESHYKAAMDRIVLGGESDALAALSEFEGA